MSKDKNFMIWMSLGPLVFIPAVVALIAFMVIDSERSFFDESLQRMEGEYIEVHESAVRSKVNNLVDLVAYRKSVIDTELHHRIQQRVEDAYQIALQIHNQYAATHSEPAIQQMIINALRPLKWNAGESFIWILDFDGVFYLAPQYLRHLEGTSILDFKDATGREVIKEEILLTKTQGAGFLWDTFTKPNTDLKTQFKQLAFVKKFGFYNWYLGSAEYLDTATQATDKELLTTLSKVSQGENDYAFVLTQGGTLLLNASRPDLMGENILQSSDSVLTQVYERVKQGAKAKNGGFIDYPWLNIGSQQIEVKRTFVKSVPGSDWIIGSGFYVDELQRQFEPQKNQMIAHNQQKMQNLMWISAFSFAIAVVISALLSFMFYRILKDYRAEVFVKNQQLEKLNAGLEQRVLDRTRELQELNADLADLAMTDSLTGIHNRYSFMRLLTDELHNLKGGNAACCLIMIDLDDFKQVNDRYGHDIGDRALIGVVQLIKGQLRPSDVFCRFGGEEFVILLPNTSLQEASAAAEKLRKWVEAYRFPVFDQITISVGVAEYQKGQEKSQFIKAADLALYDSKRNGRNQVTVSNE